MEYGASYILCRLILFTSFFFFVVNNCFSLVVYTDRWSQLCTVAAILRVAMQQNASYLRPFSVVSRFRSATQNN